MSDEKKKKKGITLKLQDEIKVRGQSIQPAPGVEGGTTVMFVLNTVLNVVTTRDNKSILLVLKTMEELDKDPDLKEITLGDKLVKMLDTKTREMIDQKQLIPLIGYQFLDLLGTLEEDED
jgi:hypothetical protein